MQAASSDGILILGGPTASGKTAFAIDLAERYGAEIVGADSRQVYRGMPVGTAAPTREQRARIPHHLVDFVDPYERYSAARFVADAAAAIAAIQSRGKRVIVVGGTGFYLRALCGEVRLGTQPDTAIRSRIACETLAHSVDVLHAWLAARNPQRAAAISPHDSYRIVRALEIDLASGVVGRPLGAQRFGAALALPTLRNAGIAFVKLALNADMATLAARIAQRTRAMLASGLIEEAERIGAAAVAADAVGYREALAYRSGWLTHAELQTTLARATRQYAKRQRTWFRSEADLAWIAQGDVRAVDAAVRRIGWAPIDG